MKIGPIDIGIPVLANIAGCVVAGIVILTLWTKNSDLRTQAFYRDRIVGGLASEGIPSRQAEAVDACNALLKVQPNQVATRLTLANILALQGNQAEAKQEFLNVAKMPQASALEKAIALTGAGVATFKVAGKDPKGAPLDEAEKYFKEAMDADKTFTDAQANYALLQPYKNPTGWQTLAEASATAALTAQYPPTAEALENTYRLMGVLLQEKKKANDALQAFDASQAIRPGGAGGNNQMRQITKLAGVVQKGLNPAARKAQLTDLTRTLGLMTDKSAQSVTATAMGMAWVEMRDDPDWAANGAIQAARFYIQAIEYDPKNRLPYDNLSALYDLQLDEISKQLKGTVTGLNGITPPPDFLKDGPKAKRFLPADKPAMNEARRILKDQEDLWRKFLDRAGPTGAEKIDARIQILICIRRQYYTMDIDEEGFQKTTLERGLQMIKELDSAEFDTGPVHFAVAMLLLDLKRYPEAHLHFIKASEKGFKSPVLEQVLADLSPKPELVGARPVDGQRWFGSRPLVSATLKSATSAEGFKAIEVTHNGETVQSMLRGTQVLYLPDAAKLVDGKHKIQISVTEAASGKKIDFPPLEFSIDRVPPVMKLTPDGGEMDGKAVFTVSLSDPTGVDIASVRVAFRSMDNAKNPTNREIVQSGRYKVSAPDLNIKSNTSIAGETFKITAGATVLPPGAYMLDISAKDLSGNEMKASKAFQVTR